jgi:hypothetical protein
VRRRSQVRVLSGPPENQRLRIWLGKFGSALPPPFVLLMRRFLVDERMWTTEVTAPPGAAVLTHASAGVDTVASAKPTSVSAMVVDRVMTALRARLRVDADVRWSRWSSMRFKCSGIDPTGTLPTADGPIAKSARRRPPARSPRAVGTGISIRSRHPHPVPVVQLPAGASGTS